MTIGEALKKERLLLGLTQEEMVQDVIHKGHYSKIERGIEGVSAESLFKILFAHQIDLDDFLTLIKDQYCTKQQLEEEKIEDRVMRAFNSANKHDIEDALNDVIATNNNIFKYRYIVAVAYFRGQLNELSPNFKNKVINEFVSRNNWVESVDLLRLFGNCMQIFNCEQLDNFMHQLLKYYTKDQAFSEKMIERVAMICNNYLYLCYFENISGKNIKNCLDYLHNLDNHSHFMFYKIAQKFYEYLFAGEKEKAKTIKDQLVSWGFNDKVASWKI